MIRSLAVTLGTICELIGVLFRSRVAVAAENLFLDQTKVDELMIATNPYEHAARLRSYEIVAELAGISARENSLQTATR